MKIDRKNNVNVGIPEFYTIQEVARALKVTERALYIWKDEGKITFTKFGKSNRISREELERFIAAGTPAQHPEPGITEKTPEPEKRRTQGSRKG